MLCGGTCTVFGVFPAGDVNGRLFDFSPYSLRKKPGCLPLIFLWIGDILLDPRLNATVKLIPPLLILHLITIHPTLTIRTMFPDYVLPVPFLFSFFFSFFSLHKNHYSLQCSQPKRKTSLAEMPKKTLDMSNTHWTHFTRLDYSIPKFASFCILLKGLLAVYSVILGHWLEVSPVVVEWLLVFPTMCAVPTSTTIRFIVLHDISILITTPIIWISFKFWAVFIIDASILISHDIVP